MFVATARSDREAASLVSVYRAVEFSGVNDFDIHILLLLADGK